MNSQCFKGLALLLFSLFGAACKFQDLPKEDYSQSNGASSQVQSVGSLSGATPTPSQGNQQVQQYNWSNPWGDAYAPQGGNNGNTGPSNSPPSNGGNTGSSNGPSNNPQGNPQNVPTNPCQYANNATPGEVRGLSIYQPGSPQVVINCANADAFEISIPNTPDQYLFAVTQSATSKSVMFRGYLTPSMLTKNVMVQVKHKSTQVAYSMNIKLSVSNPSGQQYRTLSSVVTDFYTNFYANPQASSGQLKKFSCPSGTMPAAIGAMDMCVIARYDDFNGGDINGGDLARNSQYEFSLNNDDLVIKVTGLEPECPLGSSSPSGGINHRSTFLAAPAPPTVSDPSGGGDGGTHGNDGGVNPPPTNTGNNTSGDGGGSGSGTKKTVTCTLKNFAKNLGANNKVLRAYNGKLTLESSSDKSSYIGVLPVGPNGVVYYTP